MKTFNTILGAFISIFLMTGILFKIMHWPGGGVMIVFFASMFSLYMIPVAIENVINSKKKTFSIVCNAIGAFAGMILSLGLLFKIMHWPGAGFLMIVGVFLSILFIFIFITLFFTQKEPLVLNPGIFFSIICFGLLLYGFSVGGSSSSLLVNVTVTAESIENNIDLVSENNSTIMKYKSNVEHQNSIQQIFEQTVALNQYINNLKKELYQRTDGIPFEVADTISLSQIISKDNYDVPTLILGLADPINPKNGEYTAAELKEKINAFNTVVKENSSTTKTINTVDYSFYNGKPEKWESSMFYHYTLAQVILTLNQIQLEANIICNTSLTSNLLQQTNNHQSDTIN